MPRSMIRTVAAAAGVSVLAILAAARSHAAPKMCLGLDTWEHDFVVAEIQPLGGGRLRVGWQAMGMTTVDAPGSPLDGRSFEVQQRAVIHLAYTSGHSTMTGAIELLFADTLPDDLYTLTFRGSAQGSAECAAGLCDVEMEVRAHSQGGVRLRLLMVGQLDLGASQWTTLDVTAGEICGTAALTRVNVAPSATVTVSSFKGAGFEGIRAIDGIIGVNGSGEWASLGETDPWIRLTWLSPQTVDRIRLFDRPGPTNNANGGTLTFSDSSSIAVTGIPTDGSLKEVTFNAKSITWVQFLFVGGAGNNGGLSEFQVFAGP